jgi:pyruvate kinase
MRRAKIIATVGPATMDEEKLRAILQGGVDVVRVNCSHGTAEQHRRIAETVRTLADELNKPVGLLWDLQGPRLRVAALPEPIALPENAEVVLGNPPPPADLSPSHIFLPVEAPYLATAVKAGQRILVDDGRIELLTLHTDGERVRCRVVRGGIVKGHKGINIPSAKLAVPILSEEDLADLRNGLHAGADFIALSFVRSAEDI